MKSSLYELFKMNRKHSLLKSVFYKGDGLYIIEAYDDTMFNVINGGTANINKAIDYIEKMIYRHMKANNLLTARIANYSMYERPCIYIMKINKKGLTYY